MLATGLFHAVIVCYHDGYYVVACIYRSRYVKSQSVVTAAVSSYILAVYPNGSFVVASLKVNKNVARALLFRQRDLARVPHAVNPLFRADARLFRLIGKRYVYCKFIFESFRVAVGTTCSLFVESEIPLAIEQHIVVPHQLRSRIFLFIETYVMHF